MALHCMAWHGMVRHAWHGMAQYPAHLLIFIIITIDDNNHALAFFA
jgi:hypothetical protein